VEIKMNFSELSDSAVLGAIGNRAKQERLSQNLTQQDLAKSARVALNVIKRLESGRGCTLSNFVRILRSLGKLEHLDFFLPEPGVSPVQLAKLGGHQRLEASGRRGRRRKGA
jgi:transcriptional regulator with XRE-family HTH domain